MKLSTAGLAILFMTLGACGKNQANVHVCHAEYMCAENESIVRWHNPVVKFAFDKSVPTEMREALKLAANDYNAVLTDTEIDIDPSDDRAPAYQKDPQGLQTDGVNGIYWVTGKWPWAESIPGSLAVTLTRFSDNGIVEADMFIKADPVSVGDDDPALKDYWLRYLGTHELGHALGRYHSKMTDSIMYPTINFNRSVDPAAEEGKSLFSAYDVKLIDLI